MKIYALVILLLLPVILNACGGGSDGGVPSESGTLVLLATDNLEDFSEVSTTITGIEILHTGSGSSCSVLSDAVTLDIAELSTEFLVLDLTRCPARQFNRIGVEMSRDVKLTRNRIRDDVCTYTSYKDNKNKPNVLQCNDHTCSMQINGMVNVAVNQNTLLVLDFDLKEFEVENFGESGCSVTLKVEPLNANDIEDKRHKGLQETLKGTISGLNSMHHTFTLTKNKDLFTVVYADVNQERIDDLLMLAQQNHLKAKVRCSSINFTDNECTASEITVQAEGTVSDLTEATFKLTFNPEISVDYTGADVEGTLADGIRVEVRLFGFNGTSYLAREVEAEN